MTQISTTVISNVDPFSESFSFKESELANSLPEARWRSLWGNFGIAHFHAKNQDDTLFADAAPSHDETLETLVDNECQWTTELRDFGKEYLSNTKGKQDELETPHTEATVSRAILQLARSYYKEIWQPLTDNERLALFHLAKDRFIHPKHPGLETLKKKKLLRGNPDLCLLNASFREFVRTLEEHDTLRGQLRDAIETLVDNECRWTPVLKNLGAAYIIFALDRNTILETPHTEATVSRAILQLARSYYEEIWQSLTMDEQLALFHLAKDRFIHVEHPGLEPLIRKGLLRFGPDLRLLNASFREFVLIVGERDKIKDQETKLAKLDNSLWGKLKWPVGLGFGTILFFLLATQEELRAAIPAVIALAPLLFRGLPELSGKNKV